MLKISNGFAQYDYQISMFRAHMDTGSIILCPTLEEFETIVILNQQEREYLIEQKENSDGGIN